MSTGYGQSPDGSMHDAGPPRKKMRKGTKSCLECRRRKIKCTFEEGRTAVCNECYARGSTCIDQEHGDIQTYSQSTAEQSSYSLRERVTQLEGLVKQVLDRLPENGGSSTPSQTSRDQGNGSTSDTHTAAEVLKSLRTTAVPPLVEESIQLPGGLREGAPALTLFDNAVLSRKDGPVEISRTRYNKSKGLVAALNALLPAPRDLDLILDASSDWWAIWRKMFPEITDRRCESIKESVGHSLRSENPAEIAKILLCIAMSIYQLPSDWDFSRFRLNGSRTEIMEHYVSTIDRLITSDDELAATLEGIECIVLQAKYHINLGRPRRAWLLFRRAIGFSQLLGLHRLSSRKPANPDPQWRRQVSLWCHLFQGDRYLSLVLGLPYSVTEQFCTPYIPPLGAPGDMSDGEAYGLQMTAIMAKIADRNQNPTNMPFSETMRIDQELEELAQTQPPEWWRLSSAQDAGLSVEEHFDRRSVQFFHNQVRALLHMPFMLKTSADKKYQYSHTTALESSREMIKYYEALRAETCVGPFICKLIDFQAFTAAVMILLNLLGYSQQVQGSFGPQHDQEQNQQDSALVDKTIEILKEASKEPGGHVSAQSAKALEVLASARHGCNGTEQEKQEGSIQISIPYFGTITLGAGKHFVTPKTGTYPKPGERPKQSMRGPSGVAVGLPTPPSAHSSSTQPSPAWETASSFSQPRVGHDNQFLGPEQNQAVLADDPFISFDSFLALPPQEYPTTSSTGVQTQDFSGLNGNAFDGNMTGFPFPSWGNMDLDHSWNFAGVDGPQLVQQ
jgi:Fungal specific transcription factor domain